MIFIPRLKRTILTADNKLTVRITESKNGIRLYGHGIYNDANGNDIKDYYTKMTLPRPLNPLQIPDFIRKLTQTIEEKHVKKIKPTNPQKAPTTKVKGIYSEVHNSIEDKDILYPPGWANSTKKSTVSYLIRQIFPRIDPLGLTIDDKDICTIRKELVEQTAKSKNSNKNNDDAENTVGNVMHRIQYIYNMMRENCLYYNLPEINFEFGYKVKRTQAEQPKSIPDNIRVILAEVLFRIIKTSNGGLALAVALMLFVGLRPAEAAAVYFVNINCRGTSYAALLIDKQVQDGSITDVLKTQSAYRWVVLPKIMIDLIGMRKAYLISIGHTTESIEKQLLSYSEGSPTVIARPQQVSALGKQLLRLCGLNEKHLKTMRELMQKEPDKVDNDRINDVTAYILRRDFATRACNVCGLTMDQADYLLGHKSNKTKHKDYVTTESQSEIASCLERYVFNPAHSTNPAFAPRILTPGDEFDSAINQAFEFCTDDSGETRTIKLLVDSAEAGNSIIIITPDDTVPEMHVQGRPDKLEHRKIRPLIGNIRPKGYYTQLINKANAINLCELEDRKDE